ncbi:MAG TPA: acetate uptake transporter [Opitutales bacterium]|nr:acetate uptake transporter [Opitutales bacterium]
MPDITTTQIKDTTANPAPLGLLAFGMTTVLLNLHNAGFYTLSSMILAMGIFYGGFAQVIAGVLEWKKNNTFGTLAFTSYGFFWLSLVAMVVMPKLGWNAVDANGKLTAVYPVNPLDPAGFGSYLALWGLFTGVLFIGTLRLSRALQVVFLSLTILFFMLAYGKFYPGNESFEHLTGFEGIFCGLSAMYTGLAQVLNELYGRTVLPLGAVKK